MGLLSNTVNKVKKPKSSGGGSSRPGTPTTITGAGGSQSGGYISDGKTYYNDGARINSGDSVTDSSGRRWTMGSDGKGVLSGYAEGSRPTGQNSAASGQYNSEYGYNGESANDGMLGAYEKRQKEILRKQQEALRQRIDQSVGNLENQKGTVNAGFDDAARQAYILKMQNEKSLPEQMAATGKTGGATESSTLAIGTNYQNKVNDINNNRTQTLSGIDSAINNVRTDGNIEAANLEAANAQSALDVYMQMMQNKMSMEQQATADGKNEFINTIGAYSDDFMKEIQRINRAVATGDSSEAWKIPYLTASRNEKISGMQTAQAEAEQQELENYWKQQQLQNQTAQTIYNTNRPYYKPTSGKSGGMTFAQALSAFKAGISTPEILNILGI